MCSSDLAVSRGIRSFHIDTPERIGPGNRIEHKPLGAELEVVEPFLPDGPLRVGITSGASTPDFLVQETVDTLRAYGNPVVEPMTIVEEGVHFALPRELTAGR